MTRPYDERHVNRFADDVRERFDSYKPRRSASHRNGRLTVAFSHEGGDLTDLRETWEFDVYDVRATGKTIYVDVIVHGRVSSDE